MIKLLACVLSLSVLGCVTGEDGVQGGDEDILGGSPDSGDPSVVQLRFNVATPQGIGLAECTGTLISPTVVLTAAHCVRGGFNFQYNPAQTADPFDTSSPGWIAARTGIAHPSYTGNAAQGHDVGVILLSTASNRATSALGPAPGVNTGVRIVGYGNSAASSSPDGLGSKRQVNVKVSSVTAREFVAGVDLKGTCHGDSGGPVFQNGKVVGTVSYGTTADCRGAGHYMRVDDNRAFLDQYLGGGSGGGGGGGGGTSTNSCSVSVSSNGLKETVSCTNGTCQCKINDQLTSTCTENASGCSIPGSCCGF